ncbi:MAG: BON domain-containing protein [Dehalococcoidia bacterium]|nr:BON domain-containing protein [Dehalococcoidia bacterium]
MSVSPAEIEKALEDEIGISAAIEDLGSELGVTGMVGTEGERQAALDIVSALAPEKRIIDNLEIVNVLPEDLDGMSLSEAAVAGFPGAMPETSDDESLEPGDFTDQEILENPLGASGPGYTAADEDISEGDEVYIPPTDPVLDRQGEVLGGFETTSMDSVAVPRSALDGEPGDEAIADVVRRELREDAATNGLEIEVSVSQGNVYLHGTVQSLIDAENAEEVAFRVEGVVDVYDKLKIEDLQL